MGTQAKAKGREGCLKNFEKTWLSMAVSGDAPTVSNNPPTSSASIAFNSADVIPNSNYIPSQDLCAEQMQQMPQQGLQIPHQGSQLPREWREPESDSQMQNQGFNETQAKAKGHEGCLKNF